MKKRSSRGFGRRGSVPFGKKGKKRMGPPDQRLGTGVAVQEKKPREVSVPFDATVQMDAATAEKVLNTPGTACVQESDNNKEEVMSKVYRRFRPNNGDPFYVTEDGQVVSEAEAKARGIVNESGEPTRPVGQVIRESKPAYDKNGWVKVPVRDSRKQDAQKPTDLAKAFEDLGLSKKESESAAADPKKR